MKYLIGFFVLTLSASAFAEQDVDLSSYTPERIRAIAAQVNADYDSIIALDKDLDVRLEETILIEKNAKADLEMLQDVDLREAEEGSEEIQEVTEEANVVIKEVEENIESRSNKRKGFGLAE